MKKFVRLLILFLALNTADVYAQCAMCRRIAETNYAQQDEVAKQKEMKRGRSLNHGILYLLSIPYLIGGVGALVWWKNRKRS